MAEERKAIQYGIKLSFAGGTEVSTAISKVKKEIADLTTGQGIVPGGALAALQSQLKNVTTQIEIAERKAKAVVTKPREEQIKALSQTQREVNKAIKELYADIDKHFAAALADAAKEAAGREDPMFAAKRKREAEAAAHASWETIVPLSTQRQEERDASRRLQQEKFGAAAAEGGAEKVAQERAVVEARMQANDEAEQEVLLEKELLRIAEEKKKLAEMIPPVDEEAIKAELERSEALRQAKSSPAPEPTKGQYSDDAMENLRRQAELDDELFERQKLALGITNAKADAERMVTDEKEKQASATSSPAASSDAEVAGLEKKVEVTEKVIQTSAKAQAAAAARQLAEAQATAAANSLIAAQERLAAAKERVVKVNDGTIAPEGKSQAEAQVEAATMVVEAEQEVTKAKTDAMKAAKLRQGAFKSEAEVLAQDAKAGKLNAESIANLNRAVIEGSVRVNQNTESKRKNTKASSERSEQLKREREAEAAAVKARQQQMADFESDGVIYNHIDLALHELIGQLVEARDAGGSFDETLLNLNNRISKLAGQGSTDIRKLGEQFGLTKIEAEKLYRMVEAEQANDVARGTFRQTRVFGMTFQGLSGISSAAGRLGAPGVSDSLSMASDFAQFAEQIPRMRAAIRAIPASIQNLVAQIGTPTLGLIGSFFALAAVLNLAQQENQKRIEGTRKLLEAQKSYFDFVQTASIDDIREREKLLKEQLAAAMQNRDQLQQQADMLKNNVRNAEDPALRIVDTIFPALIDMATEAGILGGEITATKEALQKANDEVASINKQLGDNANAYHDATVAQNEMKEAAIEMADQLIKKTDELRSRIGEIRGLRDLSSEDLRERRDELEADNADLRGSQSQLGPEVAVAAAWVKIGQDIETFPEALQKLILKYQEYDAAIEHNDALLTAIASGMIENAEVAEKYQKEIDGFISANEYAVEREAQLASLLNGTAEQAGDAVQSLTDRHQALVNANAELLNSDFINTDEGRAKYSERLGEILDLENQLNDIRQYGAALMVKAAQELQADILKINQALVEELDKALAEREEKEKEARSDAARAEADALDDKNKKLAKAQKEADEKEEDAEEDHRKKLKNIAEQYSDQIRDAIRGRNAAAALSAIRAANKARKEEEDRYKEQKEKLAKALKDQQQEIEDAYQEQLETIRERLADQLEDIKRAYDKQVQNAKDQAAKETKAKLDEYNKQTQNLRNFLNDETVMTSRHQADQLVALFNFSYNAGKMISDFVTNALRDLGRLGNGTSSSGGGGGAIGPFGTGFGAPITINSTIQVQTNADPDAIARQASRQAVEQVKTAVRRSRNAF